MDRRWLLGGALSSASIASLGGMAAAQDARPRSRGVYSAPGLSFAALYVAGAEGLWARNGVEVDLRQVQGGPLAMAAMTNREADFAGVASTDPVIGWDKGIKTVTVAAFTGGLAMQFTAHNDFLARTGVGPAASVGDRVKALRGARIGASTVGGGPAQYTRYLLRSHGLDPDKDARILAVGFGASRMAALRNRQVDVTVGDAPEADQIELEGYGKLYLNCSQEVPVFEAFPYTVLTVTPQVADARPDAVRRVVHAIGAANNAIADDFGRALDVIKGVFPNTPPVAIERALARDRANYPRDGRMTEQMWVNNIGVATAMGMVSAPVPTAEDTIWTNRFVA